MIRNRDPVMSVLLWGLCAIMVAWTFMKVVYRPDPHFPTHICPANGDCYEVCLSMIYWPKYADGEPMKLAEMPPPLRTDVVNEVLRVHTPMLRTIIQLLLITRGFYSMPPVGRIIEHDCS